MKIVPELRLIDHCVRLTRNSLCAACLSLPIFFSAHALDWESRGSRYLSLEGGWIEGSKIPISPETQSEFDKASANAEQPALAENKIVTKRLRGVECIGKGSVQFGAEGFNRNLTHQLELDVVASGILSNSTTGVFYNPPGLNLFPHDALGGRNQGWTLGGSGGYHWIPFGSFGLHFNGRYLVGSESFKSVFNSIDLSASAELKAARFVVKPAVSMVRLTAADTLPAADVSSWLLDVEWAGNEFIKFKNPSGYPLVKKSNVVALGSNLLIQAMENEGSYLELNLTPRLQIVRGLTLASHYRSLSGDSRSYIAPSLAEAIGDRARKFDDWTPPEASAEYSSHTIEWKNSLTKRMDRGFYVSLSVLYTSRSSTYLPSAGSRLQYSALLDKAYESSIRYFLGSEFLL